MAAMTDADWARVHARAWTDSEFAKAFEADPRAALRKYGPELGIDGEAGFALMRRPDHIDDETTARMAEGHAVVAPYCC